MASKTAYYVQLAEDTRHQITGSMDGWKGFLTTATEVDRAHGTADHIVTHTIVQSGGQQAERTDRLILGDRVFFIVDVDPACSLGIATIYYAEERTDVK